MGFLVGLILTTAAVLFWGMKNLPLSMFQFNLPSGSLAQVVPGNNEAVLYLSPESGSFPVNSTFNGELRISASASVTSAKIYLNYDSTRLSALSVDYSSSVFTSVWEADVSAPGQVKFQGSDPSGFNGNGGLVAKISFKAIAAGTANITYDPSSLALKVDDSNILNVARSTGASFTTTVDVTPPVRSSGVPSGTLAAGTTSTTLSLATDENATCRYATTSGASYSAMTAFSTTGGTGHSSSVSNLSDGNSYTYYVKCQDAASTPNTNPDDFSIVFSVSSTLIVTLNLSPASGNAPLNGVDLIADAGGSATGSISYTFYCDRSDAGTDISSNWAVQFLNSSENPKIAIDACNYSAAGTYTAKVIVARGNAPTAEVRKTLNISTPDTTAPIPANGQPSGSLPAGTTSVTLSLTSDELAACRYATIPSLNYAAMSAFALTGGRTTHSTPISGLSNGSSYSYYVKCQDGLGNTSASDFLIAFQVAAPAPTPQPNPPAPQNPPAPAPSSSPSSSPGSSPKFLKGDYNKDGKVNIIDLSILLSNWKKTAPSYDLNGDSSITIFDFSILLSNWTR